MADTGRFSRLPALAVFDRRLSAEAVRVLAALGVHADQHGHCYPSVTGIAERLGISRRQVQIHLRKLEACGYVVTRRTKRQSGGYGQNAYWLQYPALAEPLPSGAEDGGSAHPSGQEPERTSGHENANARDAKSDFASSRDNPPIKPDRCEVGAHTDAKSHFASDAKSECTGDAKSGFAQTAHINSPSETAQGEQPRGASPGFEFGFDGGETRKHRANGSARRRIQRTPAEEADIDAHQRLNSDVLKADLYLDMMFLETGDAMKIYEQAHAAELETVGSGVEVVRRCLEERDARRKRLHDEASRRPHRATTTTNEWRS